MMGYFNSTTSPGNTTDEDPYYHATIIWPLGTVISLLGLGGNGLVLFFLVCSVKWDRFSVFLFHLALADLILLACHVVDFMGKILRYFHAIWISGPYLGYFIRTSYMAGLCLVVAISVGRCLSVFFPIWCRLRSPEYSSTMACFLTWVLAISYTVLRRMLCNSESTHKESCDLFVNGVRLVIIAVLCSTLLCTGIMLLKIKCSSRVRPTRKLYIAVALAAVSISCLALPGLRLFLYRNPPFPYFDKVVALVTCVNSSANPLVYYFAGRMGRQRRRSRLREVFQRAIGEEVDSSPSPSGYST